MMAPLAWFPPLFSPGVAPRARGSAPSPARSAQHCPGRGRALALPGARGGAGGRRAEGDL